MTDSLTEAAIFELLSLVCRVDADGNARYFNEHGQLHRLHGPAVKYADGTHAWFQNDQLHRIDGPAVEQPDGKTFWYIDGKELTEAEWQQQVASIGMYDRLTD